MKRRGHHFFISARYHFYVRATFDIPAKLLNEATRLSGGKSKNRVVVIALEDFVRRGRLDRLRERAIGGQFKFDNVDLDWLRHERGRCRH